MYNVQNMYRSLGKKINLIKICTEQNARIASSLCNCKIKIHILHFLYYEYKPTMQPNEMVHVFENYGVKGSRWDLKNILGSRCIYICIGWKAPKRKEGNGNLWLLAWTTFVRKEKCRVTTEFQTNHNMDDHAVVMIIKSPAVPIVYFLPHRYYRRRIQIVNWFFFWNGSFLAWSWSNFGIWTNFRDFPVWEKSTAEVVSGECPPSKQKFPPSCHIRNFHSTNHTYRQ